MARATAGLSAIVVDLRTAGSTFGRENFRPNFFASLSVGPLPVRLFGEQSVKSPLSDTALVLSTAVSAQSIHSKQGIQPMSTFISQRFDALLCGAVTFCLLSPLLAASLAFVVS